MGVCWIRTFFMDHESPDIGNMENLEARFEKNTTPRTPVPAAITQVINPLTRRMTYPIRPNPPSRNPLSRWFSIVKKQGEYLNAVEIVLYLVVGLIWKTRQSLTGVESTLSTWFKWLFKTKRERARSTFFFASVFCCETESANLAEIPNLMERCFQ